MARTAYYIEYHGQPDLLIRAFVGLAGPYNPNMVSNYIPHPYLVYVLNPNARYQDFYGQPPRQFINSLGFRGKEFSKQKKPGVYRIICMGGSTTYSLHERNEAMTYPQMLEDNLNSVFDSPRFEVINAGTPGWTSAESLMNLQFRLLELQPDMVISYEAVNDTYAMRVEDEGKSDYSNFRQIVDYSQATRFERFLFSASAIYRFYFLYSRKISFDINQISTKGYPPDATILKNLNNATGNYFRSNQNSMIAIAKSRNITPVLVTMGHGPWLPIIQKLNQITREIAEQNSVKLVDFEATSQIRYFLGDNIHLTHEGNKALVQLLVASFAGGDLPFHKRNAN